MKNLDPGFYFEKVITLINPLKNHRIPMKKPVRMEFRFLP
jgi:hypothetical protein